MPRKYKSTAKYLQADPRFKSDLVGKFINNLMRGGKKTLAQRVFYKAVDEVVKKVKGLIFRMNSLNYDHEIECKGNSNCTCNEIIDAKWVAEKDSKL